MRILRLSSLNNFTIYHTAVLTIVIILYITSLVVIYNWSFVPFPLAEINPKRIKELNLRPETRKLLEEY